MSEIFMFRGVDYELGYADYSVSQVKTGMTTTLNNKDRKISNYDFTYRIINHWEKNGLINSNRENNKGWRRYSIMNMVWLFIIKELRSFGVSLDQILAVKAHLTEDSTEYSDFPQLEYYVSLTLVNKPVFLLIFPNGEAHCLSEKEYQLNREFSSQNNHIQINLNNIVQLIIPEYNLKPNFKDVSELNFDERKVIQLLRLGNYDEIDLTLEEGQYNKLEDVEGIDNKSKNIEDIIHHINVKSYKSINIKQGVRSIISLRKEERV